MNNTVTAYDSNIAWYLPVSDSDTPSRPHRNVSDIDTSNSSVWTFDFSETAGYLVFYSPDMADETVLPPNDPIWDHVDSILTEIWANSEPVPIEEDIAWLDGMRSRSRASLEDMLNELDTWE